MRDKFGRFIKGHKVLKKWKKILSKVHKGKHPSNAFQKGHKPWNTGKKRPEISGEKNWRWKGGISKHSNGYILILKPSHLRADHRGYVPRSSLVMEQKLGRKLRLKEQVHHINGIKDDDRPENLQLFKNHSEHMKFHYPKGQPLPYYQKRELLKC